MSGQEARKDARWEELLAKREAGKIRKLERAKIYRLYLPDEHGGLPIMYRTGRQVEYTADFAYEKAVWPTHFIRTWQVVIEDWSLTTPVRRLKQAIVEAIHGVRVTKGG